MNGITEQAGARLKEALENSGALEGACIRFTDDNKLVIDKSDPSDAAYEHDGQTVLVMAPSVSEKLAGRTLDFAEGSFQFV